MPIVGSPRRPSTSCISIAFSRRSGGLAADMIRTKVAGKGRICHVQYSCFKDPAGSIPSFRSRAAIVRFEAKVCNTALPVIDNVTWRLKDGQRLGLLLENARARLATEEPSVRLKTVDGTHKARKKRMRVLESLHKPSCCRTKK
jgi:hypothetical protein